MQLFIALFFAQSFAAATPHFLHLKGHATGARPDQIVRDLQGQYLAPLEAAGRDVLFSQVNQAFGDGHFFFNLILEAANPSAEAFVEKFLADREGLDFYGVQTHFVKVLRLRESAELEAGNYIEGRQDPFEQHAQLTREFLFVSMREWLDFSNGYGFALLDRDNAKLMAYLRGFIGDDYEFSDFRDRALSVSDMMAIFPQVTLELEGGGVSGPEFEATPFLPYRFFRNCYSSRYEGGMCWHAP